jgi:hypothetical protein
VMLRSLGAPAAQLWRQWKEEKLFAGIMRAKYGPRVQALINCSIVGQMMWVIL